MIYNFKISYKKKKIRTKRDIPNEVWRFCFFLSLNVLFFMVNGDC